MGDSSSLLLDSLRDFVVVPSSAGGSSSVAECAEVHYASKQ